MICCPPDFQGFEFCCMSGDIRRDHPNRRRYLGYDLEFMNKNSTAEKSTKPLRKRSPTRYWREMKGRLYARLQYRDEGGRWRDKLKPIPDKRSARAAVEEMRRELEERGPQALSNDTATFAQLAAIFREAKMVPAVFANKVKVAGEKVQRQLGL